MGPKTPVTEGDFFRQPLREQINLKHPLVRLAALINWERVGASMSESFVSGKGRPATSPRLIAGLLSLLHAVDLSDEGVVWQWVENLYWQEFAGEAYLQTKQPVDPSSLTRWRKRLGEAGVEELPAETIKAAKRAGVIKAVSVKRIPPRNVGPCRVRRDHRVNDCLVCPNINKLTISVYFTYSPEY